MAFSGCGIAILPCLSYWFGTSLERRYMARQHIIRVDLICVVFLGGCIGTALRYACSVIPDCGAFHIGTIRGEYGRLLRIRGAFGMAGRNPQNRGTREGICEPWMWHGHCVEDCPPCPLSPSRNSLCCMTQSHGLCGVLLHDLHRGLSAGIRWRACRAAVCRY